MQKSYVGSKFFLIKVLKLSCFFYIGTYSFWKCTQSDDGSFGSVAHMGVNTLIRVGVRPLTVSCGVEMDCAPKISPQGRLCIVSHSHVRGDEF